MIQSGNFTNFAPNLYFLVTTKKLGSDRESPHFRTFDEKRREFKISERDGHGKSRNGHGEVMEKYFVKSVGTLIMLGRFSLLFRVNTRNLWRRMTYFANMTRFLKTVKRSTIRVE